MRRRSPANHRRLAGFRRAPPPPRRSGEQRLGNPRESSSRGQGLGWRRRAPRLSSLFLPPSLSALLLLLGAAPRFSSPLRSARLGPALLHACLSFRLRAAAPLLSLGLGVVWPLPSPSGSLSRRPPHLIFFLSLRTPASDGPDPRSQRSRIRRPRLRGATVACPATVGS